MSPTDKHSIDPEVLAAAMKKCNGSWIQKALFVALLGNAIVLIYAIGMLMVNHQLLRDTIIDVKEIGSGYHQLDKQVASITVTVEGHEVRLTSLEHNDRTRN